MRQGGAVSLAVVGVHYPNRDGSSRRFEIELCAPGDPVDLRPEPDNRADERAVAVYSSRATQLGYVPAERAAWISCIIRSGRDYRAIFQASAPFGAWIRIAFDGEDPLLPQQRELSGQPDGDWPLDDWPGSTEDT